MNTRDMRDLEQTQWLFWASAIPVTIIVIVASLYASGASHMFGQISSGLVESFRGRKKHMDPQDARNLWKMQRTEFRYITSYESDSDVSDMTEP